MKKLIYLLLLSIGGIFISCKETIEYHDIYYKCFFLGEESFHMEGEILGDFSFDSFDARFLDNNFNPPGTAWEIPGIEISKNKYQVLIDIKDSDINGGIFNHPGYGNIINNLKFPENFPVHELCFFFNNQYYWWTLNNEYEKVLVDNDSYKYYWYFYLYVAEPIDLSGIYTEEYESIWGDILINTRHEDLNFSRLGWYKVVVENEVFNNDPKFSSGKNTNFFWVVEK